MAVSTKDQPANEQQKTMFQHKKSRTPLLPKKRLANKLKNADEIVTVTGRINIDKKKEKKWDLTSKEEQALFYRKPGTPSPPKIGKKNY